MMFEVIVLVFFFLRRLGVSQTCLFFKFFIGKQLWFPPSARSKIHPCSQDCLLLDLSPYIAGTFENMCFAIPLPGGTSTACEIWMASLWARQRTKERKKETNVQPKTLLSISTIFSSSLWPFQTQDKDCFKWGVHNYKHQLVVLVVSFGENYYLKEESH